MKDPENGKTCMWVKQVADLAAIHAKQFHACDNSEIGKKTETVLVQASMHVNESKHSRKSRKQYSQMRKHKKREKCSTRHGKRAYQKITELNVLTSPRCDVGCQSYKVDARNELCSIRLMSFDNIEVLTHMPQI